MPFDPILAETRFGCGLSPALPPPASVEDMLEGLVAPDTMAARFPIEPFPVFLDRLVARREIAIRYKQASGAEEKTALRKDVQALKSQARVAQFRWMTAHIARRVHSPHALRERLESFWADHFTAHGKAGLMLRATSPYIESAIRPHVAGRFEDLLIAAVTHPVMLEYLDQKRSVGPNSDYAAEGHRDAGLNENLAREILELHTLGVDGPYTQADVTQLAELMTGLTFRPHKGQVFDRKRAEPGPETVLGKTYGGDKARMRDIEAALRDIARHPATARHIAGKLAVHFVADRPDPALVRAIETAWLDSGGALDVVYGAMLRHPSAWSRETGNIKLPFDFITSACRALAVDGGMLMELSVRDVRRRFYNPLRLMGQVWQRPVGPDGLDEADASWITPQSVAARLQWAVAVPQLLVSPLPDPRDFVETALGGRAPEAVRFAARAAESRGDGIGLVLASPAFQRMV